MGPPRPSGILRPDRAATAEAYATELRAVPGVARDARSIRIPVCVASSSYPEKLRMGLEAVGLHERFDSNLVSATFVAHGKPEPDVFIYAAGWMRTPIRDCVVIEDSLPGRPRRPRRGPADPRFRRGEPLRRPAIASDCWRPAPRPSWSDSRICGRSCRLRSEARHHAGSTGLSRIGDAPRGRRPAAPGAPIGPSGETRLTIATVNNAEMIVLQALSREFEGGTRGSSSTGWCWKRTSCASERPPTSPRGGPVRYPDARDVQGASLGAAGVAAGGRGARWCGRTC